MKKISQKQLRYIVVAIAVVLLIYDIYVDSWIGALSMGLLIIIMIYVDRAETKKKASQD